LVYACTNGSFRRHLKPEATPRKKDVVKGIQEDDIGSGPEAPGTSKIGLRSVRSSMPSFRELSSGGVVQHSPTILTIASTALLREVEPLGGSPSKCWRI
jgi:hypothetical protein